MKSLKTRRFTAICWEVVINIQITYLCDKHNFPSNKGVSDVNGALLEEEHMFRVQTK